MEQTWHDTLHGADKARHTPWSRYGTTYSMEQIWHDMLHGADMARHTPWSRQGTTHSMEQTRHDTLHGADMAWPVRSVEQIFSTSFPVLHSVAIFLACYGTHSVTNNVIASTVSVNYKRFLPPQPTQLLE